MLTHICCSSNYIHTSFMHMSEHEREREKWYHHSLAHTVCTHEEFSVHSPMSYCILCKRVRNWEKMAHVQRTESVYTFVNTRISPWLKSIFNILLSPESKSHNYTPRLFELSSATGEFMANEVLFSARSNEIEAFPFQQSDLYSTVQPGVCPCSLWDV